MELRQIQRKPKVLQKLKTKSIRKKNVNKEEEVTYVAEPAIPTCPQSMQLFPIATLWPICKRKQILFLLEIAEYVC